MKTHKFMVSYGPPPGPVKNNAMDYSAISDNYEPDDPIGYGATPLEAIADLISEMLAREDA